MYPVIELLPGLNSDNDYVSFTFWIGCRWFLIVRMIKNINKSMSVGNLKVGDAYIPPKRKLTSI